MAAAGHRRREATKEPMTMTERDPLAALRAHGKAEKAKLLKLALGAESVSDAVLGEIIETFEPNRVWGLLAFLLTPDDRLGDLAPIEALKRQDPKLEAMTLRLAHAAIGDGFG